MSSWLYFWSWSSMRRRRMGAEWRGFDQRDQRLMVGFYGYSTAIYIVKVAANNSVAIWAYQDLRQSLRGVRKTRVCLLVNKLFLVHLLCVDSLKGFAGSRNLSKGSRGCGHPAAGLHVSSAVALPSTTLCHCEVTLGVVLSCHCSLQCSELKVVEHKQESS